MYTDQDFMADEIGTDLLRKARELDYQDRIDLRERIAGYRDVANLAAEQNMPALAQHADQLAEKYTAELDAMPPAEYFVPTDPASLNDCDSCQ